MSSRLLFGFTQIHEQGPLTNEEVYDCAHARRACMPTFVFSTDGQIGFRQALHHLITCRKADCSRLRRQVVKGIQRKLRILFQDTAMLGCVHVQPHLYGARKVRFSQQNFSTVAQHLANCPKEQCSSLRRALLLNVRDSVSPNTPELT